MTKTHYKITGIDASSQGQTYFEYTHQTACGYVRDNVTNNGDEVDCKLCLKSKYMEHYHQVNSSFADSSGCY